MYRRVPTIISIFITGQAHRIVWIRNPRTSHCPSHVECLMVLAFSVAQCRDRIYRRKPKTIASPEFLRATSALPPKFKAMLAPLRSSGNLGIVPQHSQHKAPRARAAFVTPSHQFPTGVALSMARRLELCVGAAESLHQSFSRKWDIPNTRAESICDCVLGRIRMSRVAESRTARQRSSSHRYDLAGPFERPQRTPGLLKPDPAS
jgi:hypothetical protein